MLFCFLTLIVVKYLVTWRYITTAIAHTLCSFPPRIYRILLTSVGCDPVVVWTARYNWDFQFHIHHSRKIVYYQIMMDPPTRSVVLCKDCMALKFWWHHSAIPCLRHLSHLHKRKSAPTMTRVRVRSQYTNLSYYLTESSNHERRTKTHRK